MQTRFGKAAQEATEDDISVVAEISALFPTQKAVQSGVTTSVTVVRNLLVQYLRTLKDHPGASLLTGVAAGVGTYMATPETSQPSPYEKTWLVATATALAKWYDGGMAARAPLPTWYSRLPAELRDGLDATARALNLSLFVALALLVVYAFYERPRLRQKLKQVLRQMLDTAKKHGSNILAAAIQMLLQAAAGGQRALARAGDAAATKANDLVDAAMQKSELGQRLTQTPEPAKRGRRANRTSSLRR